MARVERRDVLVREIVDLDTKYDPIVLMEVRRSGRTVICSGNSDGLRGLVSAPGYAYDSFAGCYPTVGQLKEYIQKHPKPNPP